MKRKIKREITEYYANGQVKMAIEYKGNWNTGEFVVLKHYDYDENGCLMKFKDQFERFDFLDKNHKKVINLSKKDFSSLWKCALAIKKLINVGNLDITEENGYRWAVKYCTINGVKIKDFNHLIDDYNKALERKEDKILKFEKNTSS